MKIYFACTGKGEPVYLPEAGLKTILCSYHYYMKHEQIIADLVAQDVDLFIDSGAFSANSLGKPIDIDSYCDFIKRTGVSNYVCLDVIRNAEETDRNLKYMESVGLKPFPVFHKSSPIEWLETYLRDYDKIALGGAVSSGDLIPWLDGVWRTILKIKPTMNVHGFGITSPEVMLRYPWTSCDSSSFKAGKRFGRLVHYLPHKQKFFTTNYNVWVREYAEEQGCPEILEDSKLRYKITDTYAAKSFQRFAEDKEAMNLSYPHLTNQYSLF